MACRLNSAPRSRTLSRSPPHKQLQQTAITTVKRPWICHSGCERSSIRSFQTLGPLDAWVTNRFRGVGTSKAQRHGVKLVLHCSSPVLGGGYKESAECEWRRGCEKWRVGRRMGEMIRIWKGGLLGVPVAHQHPPDCRRWYLLLSVLTSSPIFLFSNSVQVPPFEIGEFF